MIKSSFVTALSSDLLDMIIISLPLQGEKFHQ
jgi:hypothetical protein